MDMHQHFAPSNVDIEPSYGDAILAFIEKIYNAPAAVRRIVIDNNIQPK